MTGAGIARLAGRTSIGAPDVGRRLLAGLTVLVLAAGCAGSAGLTPTPTPTPVPSPTAATPT